MTEYEAIKEFCRIAGIKQDTIEYEQALRMVRHEAEDIRKGDRSRNKYSEAIEQAGNRMVDWYKKAEPIEEALHSFVASRRRAFIWVTFLALHNRKET